MGMPLLILLLAASGDSTESLPARTELTFRGSFTAEQGEPGDTRKTFDLTVLIARSGADGASLYWTLQEQGHGEWLWPHRFGRWEVDGRGRAPHAPSLRYVRPQGASTVPIVAPLLSAGRPLAQGLTWKDESFEHRVTSRRQTTGATTFGVEIRDRYGIRRVAQVEQDRPLIRSLTERVFIGQGEQFELKFELMSEQQISPQEFENAVAAIDQLAALRERVGVEPQSRTEPWNDQQLAALKAELPAIAGLKPVGAWERLLEDAQLDARQQQGQAGAVAAMRKMVVGRPSPEFSLENLKGDALTTESLAGKITVLHFWEYRDTPLEEPYGQVAYLDYLYRNRNSDDVQVCGVIADPRLADIATRNSAIRSARKLKSFMNLSYPVFIDDGLLQRIGDPRVSGAKLPLYILIGRDGRVIDYHAGLYEVTRDRGLAALETAVNKALDATK